MVEQDCWQHLCPHGRSMLEHSLPKGLSPVQVTQAGAVLRNSVNLTSSFLTLHNAYTSIGSVANKASHTSKQDVSWQMILRKSLFHSQNVH